MTSYLLLLFVAGFQSLQLFVWKVDIPSIPSYLKMVVYRTDVLLLVGIICWLQGIAIIVHLLFVFPANSYKFVRPQNNLAKNVTGCILLEAFSRLNEVLAKIGRANTFRR